MAPIFKTPAGLPLTVYIEPSSSNRPVLHKSILTNGGAPSNRIDKAKVILVDAQSRGGRACARELASDPERVVLFVEWVEACLSAGKLLGEDLDWGNLRIQDPEIVDDNLYEDTPNDSHPPVAHVKQEENVDSKNHRPWPTPTSPTRPPQGELPVSTGGLPSATATPPLAKVEIFDSGAGPSHYEDSRQRSPEPRHSSSLSPLKSSKESSPIVLSYGQPPIEPEYANLFLTACEEWEDLKKEAATYVPPPKRKSQSFDRHVSLDRPGTKSPRRDLSQEYRTRSPDLNSSVYQPLAKKRRPPLPPGSTKRGPKRRVSENRDEFTTTQQPILDEPSLPVELDLADDSDDVFEIPAPQSLLQSSPSRNPKKLFTYMDEPMQFSFQTDLPNRVAVIRLVRKYGGITASKMEDASYIIVSKSTPQYQEFVQEAAVVDRPAVPVAWINRCVEENRIVSTDGFAVTAAQRVVGTLTDEDIIRAAMADSPPSPVPSSSWVRTKGQNYKFTELDHEYMQKALAWIYARDPSLSMKDFFQDLAESSPNHPYNSWVNYYYHQVADMNRIFQIVNALKS